VKKIQRRACRRQTTDFGFREELAAGKAVAAAGSFPYKRAMPRCFFRWFQGRVCRRVFFLGLCFHLTGHAAEGGTAGLQRIQYNNPGLTVNLGVGLWAWPVPVDFDGDGDLDLVVICPDKPSNGAYFFENVSGNVKFPVFKPGVRISQGLPNISPSYVNGQVRVLGPGVEYAEFCRRGLELANKLPVAANIHANKVRANQWKYFDFDGDGKLDLIVGVEDWAAYGWDNAYDARGQWKNGPLHGYVYWLRNTGSNEQPKYAVPVKIEAGGRPIDTFGMPSPNFADFDGDGDFDLICGEFLDGFTYFENIGTRTQPKYAPGRRLAYQGKPLAMDLEMIVPVAVDWNKDGHVDLIVGQEDGRVALIENTGEVVDGLPQFLPPRFFQQEAADVKFGVLATPVSFDWDGDGLDDLICGNSAGYIGFIKNLGGNPPKWAAPEYLEADGRIIRLVAGPNGSIQGPAEAKWGYTTLGVADWDHDGRPDILANSIWGKVVWFRNTGTLTAPKLSAAQPIEVEWPGTPAKPAWNWWTPSGRELATQWRTTPFVCDFNHDGLNDLIMLDSEGYLAFFERVKQGGQLKLLPPRRIFRTEAGASYDSNGRPSSVAGGWLRLNDGSGGRSGRRKFCLVDWDGDGRPDLLVNSGNVSFLKNILTQNGGHVFRDEGLLDGLILAGHDTSPTVVDWGKRGIPDLLVGAEDGHFYFLKNPRADKHH